VGGGEGKEETISHPCKGWDEKKTGKCPFTKRTKKGRLSRGTSPPDHFAKFKKDFYNFDNEEISGASDS